MEWRIINGLLDVGISIDHASVFESLKDQIRRLTWRDDLSPETFAKISIYSRVCFSIMKHSWVCGLSQEDAAILLEIQEIRNGKFGGILLYHSPRLRKTGHHDPVFSDSVSKGFQALVED